MSEEIKISAKDLGALNMPDFCPACFWLKRKVKKLPFQIFPGIFSSIDAYSKKVIHAYIDHHGKAPGFIPEGDKVKTYHKAPHWSKFKRVDEETGITVSGVVDDILELQSGLFIIPDNKTAKYTENQDKLRPIYDVQQNGYRWIFEGIGMGTVHSIPLLYWEPVTTDEDAANSVAASEMANLDDQFAMMFKVKAVQVEKDDKLIPAMLKKAKEIIESVQQPEGTPGCDNCKHVAAMVDTVVPWSE